MYLMEQKADGTRFAATPNDIKRYSKALADAEDNLRRYPDTVALYLYNDGGSHVVRTYVRATKPDYRGVAEVIYGYHEWPKPPTFYPGRLPMIYEELAHELTGKPCSRYRWHDFDFVVRPGGLNISTDSGFMEAYREAKAKAAEPRLCGFSASDIAQLTSDNGRLSKELAEARSSLQHEHDALVSIKAGLRDLVSRFKA